MSHLTLILVLYEFNSYFQCKGWKIKRNDKEENTLPVNLFQGSTDYFNGKEFKKFVAHIKWRIEYKVPANIKTSKFTSI